MENAAYVALSRQMALRRELDIVANNIANADTTGFKVEQLLLGEEVGERARNAFVRPGVSFVLDPLLGQPAVAADGTISQNGQPVGRLSVVRFDTLAALEKGGDGLYRNASNAAPVDANDVQLRQGMLEGSNVNPIVEITNLIEIQRAYESVTRMIENTNDLSRRAVERLGRAA